MKTFFTLFSHSLTDEQTKDIKQSFGVQSFIALPAELQIMWSNVPPELSQIDEYAQTFKDWLKQNANFEDIVLISGDFGLTCRLAVWCKENGLVPVYSTTKREVIESIEDGKAVKKSIFKHVKFRKII